MAYDVTDLTYGLIFVTLAFVVAASIQQQAARKASDDTKAMHSSLASSFWAAGGICMGATLLAYAMKWGFA